MAKYRILPGQEHNFYYIHAGGGSMTVGVNAEGKIPMVLQYRPNVERETLEFPAGRREEGKNEMETALAELAEETQFAARHIEPAGTFDVSPGLTDYVAHVFVAYDLYSCPTAPDATEDIEVQWFTPEEIDQMIDEKTFLSGWSLAAWSLTRKRILEIIAEQK